MQIVPAVRAGLTAEADTIGIDTAHPRPRMPAAQPTPTMQGLVRRVAERWWVLALRGLLLVVLGLYVLFQPKLGLVAFVVLLGAFVMADGAIAIVAALAGAVASRGWTLARGVLLLAVGAAIVWQPLWIGKVAGVTLVVLIALASMLGGAMEIAVGLRARREFGGGGWLIFSGALTVLFGVVLVAAPLVSLSLLISLSGVVAALIGAVLIFSAFRLRRLKGLFVG